MIPNISQLLPYLQFLSQILGQSRQPQPQPAAPMSPQQIGNMMQPQLNNQNMQPGPFNGSALDPRYSLQTPLAIQNNSPTDGKPLGTNDYGSKMRYVKPPQPNPKGKSKQTPDTKPYSGSVK